jgi:hypothetical protein
MPALRLGMPRAELPCVRVTGADLMGNDNDNVDDAVGELDQVRPAEPWYRWVLVACVVVLQSGWIVFTSFMGLQIRYSIPVCIGLIVATDALALWIFLRFRLRADLLTKSPQYSSRLAGSVFVLFLLGFPYVVTMWLQGDRAFLSGMRTLITLVFVNLGVAIARAGARRNVGDEQTCSGCGYECRTSSDRCSECGSLWREPGGLTRGRRVVQPTAIVVGVLIALIGVVGMFPTRFSIEGLSFKLMPESVRIRWASTGAKWSSEDRLKDVLAGKLSPENELLLATSLLDQRIEEQGLSATATVWLEKKVLAGGLPEPIRERFFDEMVEFWLEGPDEVVAGRLFRPIIASRDRFEGRGSVLDVRVLLAGVSTDGGKTFNGGCSSALHPYYASNVRYYRGKRSGPYSSLGNCVPNVLIDTPGDHEIVVRMWVVVVPRPTTMKKVEWNDDGTPVLPPNAVWTKEVLLRRAVVVEER